MDPYGEADGCLKECKCMLQVYTLVRHNTPLQLKMG